MATHSQTKLNFFLAYIRAYYELYTNPEQLPISRPSHSSDDEIYKKLLETDIVDSHKYQINEMEKKRLYDDMTGQLDHFYRFAHEKQAIPWRLSHLVGNGCRIDAIYRNEQLPDDGFVHVDTYEWKVSAWSKPEYLEAMRQDGGKQLQASKNWLEREECVIVDRMWLIIFHPEDFLLTQIEHRFL